MRISLWFTILYSLRRGLDTLRKPLSVALFYYHEISSQRKKKGGPIADHGRSQPIQMAISGMKLSPQSLPQSQLGAPG